MPAIRLGIDFGVAKTVVAATREGAPFLVEFVKPDGEVQAWHPALIGAKGAACTTGLQAQGMQLEDGWDYLRAPRRLLAGMRADASIVLGEATQTSLQWVIRYLSGLRRDLIERTALDLSPEEPIDAAISIPASADGNQRFLTLEAFQDAGFRVLDMVDQSDAIRAECVRSWEGVGETGRLLVYDLGEESFNASVTRVAEDEREVLAAAEIVGLGGEQFDRVLLQMVLERASQGFDLPTDVESRLLRCCRERRENLHPNTRRIVIPLGEFVSGLDRIKIACVDYFERSGSIVNQTVEAAESVLSRLPEAGESRRSSLDCVYVTGSASNFPPVSRALRERLGRRVRRSPDGGATCALGLAIAASRSRAGERSGCFDRHFGMWREADCGGRKVFDPIFHKGTRLPDRGEEPLVVTRRYRPSHNIGYMRYLDCGELREDGLPISGVTPWEEVAFPFDPSLEGRSEFRCEEVVPVDHLGGQEIEERYTCSANGAIELSMSNLSAGYVRRYQLRA